MAFNPEDERARAGLIRTLIQSGRVEEILRVISDIGALPDHSIAILRRAFLHVKDT